MTGMDPRLRGDDKGVRGDDKTMHGDDKVIPEARAILLIIRHFKR